MTMPKKPRTHYEVLGVETTASPEEIKKAHRKRVRNTHPDHNPDADPQEAAAVNVAADVLLDPVKRLEYDNAGYREGKDGKAFTAAMGMVQQIIEAALDQDVDDIPRAVSHAITQNIAANKKRLLVLRETMAKLERRRKRIGRKAPAGAPNLIHQVIDRKVKAIDDEIEGVGMGLHGLELAREAFTGYTDRPEEEAPSTRFHTSNARDTGGFEAMLFSAMGLRGGQ